MHATHDPNTIVVPVATPRSVYGVCDYCGTPDVARVLVTDGSGHHPRLVCADPAFCAGAAPSELFAGEAAADGYTITDAGRHALAELTARDVYPDVREIRDDEAPGTAGQVLLDAALYLKRHGWIQGAYYDATSGSFTPPSCLVGAIGMVCYGGPVDAPAQHFDDPGYLDFEEAVLHLDRYLLVEDGSESYEFNDAKGRQLADVTRVLCDAAARPAHELIDAIRVIDARNATVAAIAELLKPCGIFGETAEPQQQVHADYPHTPGTLYDCPACEATCFCADGFECVHCAIDGPQNFTDCRFCGAPGGYPYCQRPVNGTMSCADVVAANGDATTGGVA